MPLPSPAPPVPIPYPGTMQAHAGQFEPGTKKIKVGSKKVVAKRSPIPRSQGDEAGKLRSIVSSRTMDFGGGAMGIQRAAKLRKQRGDDR